MPDSTVTKVKVSIDLPESLYDLYHERAIKFGRTVEDEIFLRLKACQSHTSTTAVYINDEERAELSKMLGRTIAKPADLLRSFHRFCDLKVGEVKVALPERVQLRIKTRVPRGKTPEQYLQKEVIEGLERSVGLRPY